MPQIATQIAALAPHKRIASLFLLPQCDMSCRFCASEAEFSVMGFEQALELLYALRDRGVRNVVFGGGEPCRWPHDLDLLCRRARELGFLVQLCTNGIGLDHGFEHAGSIDRFILPLEAMNPGIHDRLRVHPGGHHALVLRRLEALARSESELSVSTVVTRDNVGELGPIAGFLSDAARNGLPVHAWHLYRFLPVGRGGRARFRSFTIPRRVFLEACSAARRRSSGFDVYRRDNMLRSSSVEFFWFEGRRLRVGFDPAAGSNATPRAGAG